MSLDGTYEEGNIFARLIRGEIPSARIWEDDDVLAFMDAFPQASGHCLVISKTSRARNLLDVEPEVLRKLTAAVQRTARAVRAALEPDGVIVTQYNGSPAGQTVFHLHFHIIPVRDGAELKRHGGGMADMATLQAQANAIAARL
jgi:histidine triad (HIT) family protein